MIANECGEPLPQRDSANLYSSGSFSDDPLFFDGIGIDSFPNCSNDGNYGSRSYSLRTFHYDQFMPAATNDEGL
jgi:hypothetical protein